MRRTIKQRMAAQDDHCRKLLAELGAVSGAIFSRDGMIANWEFLPLDSADTAVA